MNTHECKLTHPIFALVFVFVCVHVSHHLRCENLATTNDCRSKIKICTRMLIVCALVSPSCHTFLRLSDSLSFFFVLLCAVLVCVCLFQVTKHLELNGVRTANQSSSVRFVIGCLDLRVVACSDADVKVARRPQVHELTHISDERISHLWWGREKRIHGLSESPTPCGVRGGLFVGFGFEEFCFRSV